MLDSETFIRRKNSPYLEQSQQAFISCLIVPPAYSHCMLGNIKESEIFVKLKSALKGKIPSNESCLDLGLLIMIDLMFRFAPEV